MRRSTVLRGRMRTIEYPEIEEASLIAGFLLIAIKFKELMDSVFVS